MYPDVLRTYGDRGNVLTLLRRAEWRGFRVALDEATIGESVPAGARLILLGGGTDRAQRTMGPDLAKRRHELAAAAESGAVVIGICGGYQLLGERFVAADGEAIDGLGLLDARTVTRPRRITGPVRAVAQLWGRALELVGFENHGGRTSLGPRADPLGVVPKGQGNNGRDGTEGALQGNVVGTYLHGPVLPLNPMFADTLLERALGPLTGWEPLSPLDDSLERRAHEAARRMKR